MTREELLERLKSVEWNDIEFKEASWAVPNDALSTVSAFANTEGGHLVFGIKEKNGSFLISGVINADKVQNDFLGHVRDRNKISVFLPINGQLHTFDEGTVIVFYIPEAQRNQKPVFLDGNPKKAYIRRGGRDDTCVGDELIRFIRDASDSRYDDELLEDLSIERCFDESTVRWYRQRHAEKEPGRFEQLTDIAFLQHMGCVSEKQNQLFPTRAGVLVFGTEIAFIQILKRPPLDFLVYSGDKADYPASGRYFDRLQPIPEVNLIKTWQALISFYTRQSQHPFAIDPGSLRRADDPPDYISFREAVINLLIHQDYGDQSRWPTICFYRDCSEFFNPGDAFSTREQLLDPGAKPIRNPTIVALFRRIGLSDQAGSGVSAIFESCRKLGYLPPIIDNQKAEKAFRLVLPKERLVTEEQLLIQASLGVNLTEQEAAVFAFVTHKQQIDLADVKGLTGLNGAAAQKLIQRLTVQAILEPIGESQHLYSLAAHLRQNFSLATDEKHTDFQTDNPDVDGDLQTKQVTVQVGQKATAQVPQLVQLNAVQRTVIANTDTPRTLNELLSLTGYKQKPFFKAQYIEPLINGGILRMTIPDKPRSSNQKYVLTEAGVKLKTHASNATKPLSEQETD